MSNSKGDLWDDSALVNAFDQAMTKFKGMHVTAKADRDNSSGFDEANGKQHATEASHANDGSEKAVIGRPVIKLDTDQDSTDQLPMKVGPEDVEHLSTARELKTVNTQESDEYLHASNTIPMQDNSHNLPSSQGLEDYDQLCKRYYELEGEKLQIWQKLQQYSGGWNYPYPGEFSSLPTPYGTGSTSQDPFTLDQSRHPTVAVSCYPCACPCSVVPCSSLPFCSLCGPCGGISRMDAEVGKSYGKQPATIQTDVVRKGMETAEKVTSMMKEKVCDSKMKIKSFNKEGGTPTSTDLTAVLNAWYCAGFYTGKYLTEQSLPRKQDG